MSEVDSAETEAIEWDLEPGAVIERKQLHVKYGGRTQGGIGPSAKTPNVMIFTDPIAGEKHGTTTAGCPMGSSTTAEKDSTETSGCSPATPASGTMKPRGERSASSKEPAARSGTSASSHSRTGTKLMPRRPVTDRSARSSSSSFAPWTPQPSTLARSWVAARRPARDGHRDRHRAARNREDVR